MLANEFVSRGILFGRADFDAGKDIPRVAVAAVVFVLIRMRLKSNTHIYADGIL